VEGRAVERERGALQVLEPDELREYVLRISVTEGQRQLDALVKTIRSIG